MTESAEIRGRKYTKILFLFFGGTTFLSVDPVAQSVYRD